MRHWAPEKARGAGFGRIGRFRSGRRGGRARRAGRIGAAHIALMANAGVALGLGVALLTSPFAPRQTLSPAIAQAGPAADPYAEARRSRALLAAQEGAPAPVRFAGSARSGRRDGAAVTISPGAVRVIDGDTFVTGGMRVRIADIDAPETHPPRCAHEADLGNRATARMRALLAAGPFELHPIADGRDTDRYGRKLRIVTRAGRSLGDQLVGEGLARTWTGRREPWC